MNCGSTPARIRARLRPSNHFHHRNSPQTRD
jgi:hypothetical protein